MDMKDKVNKQNENKFNDPIKNCPIFAQMWGTGTSGVIEKPGSRKR